jgi:hypothetical protein
MGQLIDVRTPNVFTCRAALGTHIYLRRQLMAVHLSDGRQRLFSCYLMPRVPINFLNLYHIYSSMRHPLEYYVDHKFTRLSNGLLGDILMAS